MSVEIIINATPEETRVARLEDKAAVEIHLDRKKERGVIGNIYKGRVVKVLPGIQAAFVDIGLEKAAFLYVADVMPPGGAHDPAVTEAPSEDAAVGDDMNGVPPFMDDLEITEEPALGEAVRNAVEEGADRFADPSGDAAPRITQGDGSEAWETATGEDPARAVAEAEGVETVPGAGDGVEAGEAGEDAQAVPASSDQKPTRARRRKPLTIEALLKEGQEVIVQVSKEPIGTKGSRVTTYVSLPGRFLVYLPNVNHIGVSRRITQDSERRRLKDIIRRLKNSEGGYIVRTVSDGMTDEALTQDMEFLEAVWQETLRKQEGRPAPVLLHSDLDLIFRTVRDLFTHEVDRLIIDSKPEYERIKEYVKTYLAGYASRLQLWEKEEPIFEAYGLEAEIARAKNRKVWLKSGGYLVIDRAEALTVIDVNTGRYVGKKDLEETILKTNLEACKEIAHQLRLRNTGGIIIIDFIDMEKEKNREKVFATFNEALARDKAKTHILKISDLGLVQMSRERTREDLMRALCEPCCYCEGRGYTKSPTTVGYEIFRAVRRLAASPRYKKVIIGVHPSVADFLCDAERPRVEALEREYQRRMIIKADANLHVEQYEIVPL